MSFPAIINLATIDGAAGFRLVFGGGPGFGRAFATGDINGDGQADLIVGLNSGGGRVAVLFGPFLGTGAELDVATSSNFQIVGLAALDHLGDSVAAFDVNGDGFDDVVAGASGVDDNGVYSGAVYVLFGGPTAGALPASLSDLNGANGFKLIGSAHHHQAGWTVASAGDMNGDGYGDILINAVGDFNAEPSRAYVVFGRAGGFAASLSLADLDGSNGFALSQGAGAHKLGATLASAGDFNGDGLDDIILGAQGTDSDSGAAYVIFGSATPGALPALWTPAALNGANGFAITPDTTATPRLLGTAVSSAGDVNGDGFDDIVVTALSGETNAHPFGGAAYVIFGTASPMAASLNVTALDGTNGFRIASAAYGGLFGIAVSSAGDINGDGFDDLVVGASSLPDPANGAGAAYVILGKASGFGAEFSAASLDGVNGFRLRAANGYDSVGSDVSGGADLNGDGMPDLLVGAPGYPYSGYGAVYVVFGGVVQNFAGGAGDDVASGGGLGDIMTGGGGKDQLSGLGGPDTLDGGDGNDILLGGTGGDTLNGGAGNDILEGGDGDDQLTDTLGANKLNGGAGNDVLTGGGGADRMDGGTGDDILAGAGGNDYLDGGSGTNVLGGGAGNDVYIVRSAADTVGENAGEGTDTVRAMVGYTLGANVESLELLTGLDLTGIGNDLGNVIKGNAGANLLQGMAGADRIDGGDGADILIGGTGRDQLAGGAGADSFRVQQDSLGQAVIEIDRVLDYEIGVDLLDFSAIDADGMAANGDTAFVVVNGFTRAPGQLFMFYTAAQDSTTIRLDQNGDGRADYQLVVDGNVTAEAGRWLL